MIDLIAQIHSLKLTANASEKRPFAPKRNEKVFLSHHISGAKNVSFKEGKGKSRWHNSTYRIIPMSK